MARRKLTESDALANLAATTRLLGTALCLCRRDDATVLKQVAEHRRVDEVYGLDQTTFCDEFFQFLQELKVWPLLAGLDPGQRWRPLIPWAALIGVYVMRLLMGIPSVPQMEGLILTDPALMGLFGFAPFVVRGVTRRGVSRAKSLPDVRGAFSGEAVVDGLVKISAVALARVFNAVIARLAAAGFFPDRVHAVIDCTDFEATRKFRTLAGTPVTSVRREKRPRHRDNRHARKGWTTLWGWKIWLMWCPASGIPIAVYVDRINVDDRTWLLPLVLQGRQNLGPRLATVTFDRGFLDGVDLYRVHQLLPFFIPGKAGMEVTKIARGLGQRAKRCYEKGLPVRDGTLATRPVLRVEGRGRHRRQREETLVVVGLTGIPFDTYAPEPVNHKVYQKSFRPNTVNAVVVLADPDYAQEEGEELVILTDAPVDTTAEGLFAYDRFSSRGIIENSGNREAKQPWKLLSPLEKSEAAVYLHVYFVFLMMALVAAFRARQEKEQAAQATGPSRPRSGMQRYRQQLRMENRDKVLVRIGDLYGIFRTWELMVVIGLEVATHEGESVASILSRYGVGGAGGGASP